MSVYSEFEWSGMIYGATEGLEDSLARPGVAAYIGFDPTASSLHVGSLLPVMALARLQVHGHTPIALIGGGTGLIGDPSGKQKERPMLTREEMEAYAQGLRHQLARFLDLDCKGNSAIILNNAEWLEPIRVIDFLRDIGKHFTVNSMISKESVRRRLGHNEGISFTEFSYMLLQAYDFVVLNRRYNCTLQMGGSDQWGNILAGIDLVRHLNGVSVDALVFPLLTTASGRKLGKSERGNVWLDAELTSPFHFHQFWLNTDDKDVINYLKYFTWLSMDQIQELEASASAEPEKRAAQRRLAREVTRMVHGDAALASAERASETLFGAEISGLGVDEILDIFDDVPSTEVRKPALEGRGIPIVDLAVKCGIAQFKAEARRLVQAGGLYLNNMRVTDVEQEVSLLHCIGGQVIVLRKGKKSYHLVKVTAA